MFPERILAKSRKQRLLIDVTLELTYACNLDCFYCYNDRDKVGQPLSLQQYRDLLKDLASMQTMFLMLSGGEPMIHPHFFDIGRLACELGFVTRVRTNGHNLTQRMAQRVRDEVDPYMVEVSLHGASAESHDKQTRVSGSFDRLIKNIAIAGDAGLRVGVVSTPTAWNEHQIQEMFELCDQLKVPLRFQGPVAPRDNGDLTPLQIQPQQSTWGEVSAIIRSRRESNVDQQINNFDHSIPDDEPEQDALCGVGVAGVDIDPYGNVQACMHLQESAGNLHQQSIQQIWTQSPLFQRARAKSIAAAEYFKENKRKPEQLGAPIFCIAVEENLAKGKDGDSNCGQCRSACQS